MGELTFEQWLTLLVTIGGAFGAIWTFLAKTYFPARQKLRELEAEESAKQRAHERQIQKDRLEHEQEVELRNRNNEALQASWREDKISELLEKDSSFIREEIRSSQQIIEKAVTSLPKIEGEIETSRRDLANLKDNFRLLLGIVQEIYEDYKDDKR